MARGTVIPAAAPAAAAAAATASPAAIPDPALSKSQYAYEWIKERITRQDFAPGYRLVLGSIARELDMSAVPVREAIRGLEAEGLVTFERNVGARVSMVDDSAYRHSMQTLSILEGAATALAARSISSADIKRARALNARLTRSLERFDPHAFTSLNQQFHAVLFEHCDNPRLLEMVRAEWDRLDRLRDSTFSFVPDRAAESVREHEQILALIETAAPLPEIEHAARHHRAATLDAYLVQEHPDEAASLAVY